MKFLQRSLAARLLILFLLLAIVPLFVIGFLAYDSGRRSIVSNVEAHLESVAILKEQEIQNWVKHLEHSITWLATSPQTTSDAAALATHAAGDPEYLAAHDSLVAELDRVAAVGHVSPVFLLESASGQIIASSNTSWEGQFRETEPWFIQGKTSTCVSDILHSLGLGRPTMVIAAPVTDSDGQLLGVLAGHADLGGLSDIMVERSGLGDRFARLFSSASTSYDGWPDEADPVAEIPMATGDRPYRQARTELSGLLDKVRSRGGSDGQRAADRDHGAADGVIAVA